MKWLNHKVLMSVFALTASGLLGSCSGQDSSTARYEEGVTIAFVATTSEAWDAEVTLGSFVYQFDVELNDDKSVAFKAECIEEASQGGGGGGGFPGGGQGGQQETTTSKEPMSAEELDKQDFSFGGTWELEEGYGYIINFQDDAKSVIHVDYNKTQGRHEFYYLLTHGEDSATVHFQAKDSEFRNQLATDYKTWDERDSDYIFIGETTGNNNSLAYAYLYCHKDGSAKFDTAKNADRAITLGLKWAVKEGNFTLTDTAGTTYTAENSLSTAKNKGYRLSYSSVSLFCSTGSVDSLSMTNEDFDGKTLYQFTGTYVTSGPDGKTNEVALNFTDNQNKMFLYTNNKLSKKGTYTFENEVFTLTFENEEPIEVKKVDGKYEFTFKISGGSGPFASEVDVTITYVPEA